MDDIFFSDKPGKKNSGSAHGADRFQNDLFSDTPKKASKKKFEVHLPPQENRPVIDERTPRGRRIDDLAQAGASGSNSGSIISSHRTDAPKMPTYTPTPTVRQSAITASKAMQETPVPPVRRLAAQSRPVVSTQPTSQRTSAQRTPPKRKKERHLGRKIVAAVLALLLVFSAAIVGYGYLAVGKMSFDETFDPDNPYISQSELMHTAGVKNILFIGSDARGDVQGQRSDTMLICSIDSTHHKMKLTSLLRDSYVYIPSKQYHTKLNAAFSYGGANLLVDTIEYNFKIKIDAYVLIDFEGFVKLVDSMGGLDIDGVTKAEAKYLRDTVKILYAKEGTTHFSGKATLWYCRIRYLDDDFHRTERQRKVIHAIINQALRKGPVKLTGIVNEVLPYITTSLPKSQVPLTALSAVVNFFGKKNPQHQIPADGTWSNARINGADVLKFDSEKNVELLKEFIYE